jgi:hypothetical protein
MVENDMEFLGFYFLVSYILTVPRYMELQSASAKATAMKGIFIHLPFLWGDPDQLVCDE